MSVVLKENSQVVPVCPHCQKPMNEIWYQELDKDMGKRCLYVCPECRAPLGISHRKGLTFGW